MLSYEANFVLVSCWITTLKSRIRVTDSSGALKKQSLYMGQDIMNNCSVPNSFFYSGQLVVEISDGDYIYIDTQTDITTGVAPNPDYSCDFIIYYNEL